MSRLDDLMSDAMEHFSRSLAGEELTLYNYSDQQTDSTDAPVFTEDAGVTITGHIDWKTTDDVVSTVGGEEVRADADAFIPTEYDIRDGRASGERASVIEDPDGNEFRVEHAYEEAGVFVCTLSLTTTQTDESF